jgi:hypothetical protein
MVHAVGFGGSGFFAMLAVSQVAATAPSVRCDYAASAIHLLQPPLSWLVEEGRGAQSESSIMMHKIAIALAGAVMATGGLMSIASARVVLMKGPLVRGAHVHHLPFWGPLDPDWPWRRLRRRILYDTSAWSFPAKVGKEKATA